MTAGGIGRRSVLAGLSAAVVAPALPANAATVSYAGLRIAKAYPGAISTPQLVLPADYQLTTGANDSAATPWQYYCFLTGPTADAVPVTIRWPGERIDAVVGPGAVRLPLTRRRTDEVELTVPVTAASKQAAILQIRTGPPTVNGVFYRIEHNDPARAAGVWTTVPWPEGERVATVNYLVASELIIRDSGLAQDAASRGELFYLTGFETYTTLHADNPPHWHLGYYAGPMSGPYAAMPHLWLDAKGRTFYNGMDVPGQGRLKFYAGDPAPIYDKTGRLVITLTIRPYGGLDIHPPNGPTYEIVGNERDGLTKAVTIRRAGRPWRRLRTRDLTRTGHLIVDWTDLTTQRTSTTAYHYDPHTGAIRSILGP